MRLLPDLRRWRTEREQRKVANAIATLRNFNLKNPGPLIKWGADLLGLDPTSVSKPYSQSIWVYRCINLWLRVAQVPLLLKAADESVIDTGPIRFLFDSPNTEMTGPEMNELLFLFLALEGEHFLLREDGTNFTGVPRFLTVVAPSTMKIRKENISDGRIVSWTLMLKGREKRIDARGVIQGKLPNPYSPWRGLSPITALRLTVDADFAARTHNKWQMERHGRVSNLVSLKEAVGPEKLKTYAKLWREVYEGAENTGKTAFLDNGAALTQLSLSMKDLDWLQGQKLSREEIAAGFGIPPNNAGILDKATYSNFEQSTKSLWEDTLIPLGNRLTGRLTKTLVTPNAAGQKLAFDFANAVPALQVDIKEKIEWYTSLVTKGRMTPRQAAEIAQIPLGDPDPAHDVIWVTLTDIPASDVMGGQLQQQDPEPKTIDVEAIVQDVTKKLTAKQDEREERQKAASMTETLRQAKGRSILRDGLPFEKKLVNIMKRFFFDQRQEVTRNMEKLAPKLKSMDPKKRALEQTPQQAADALLGGIDWNGELTRRTRAVLAAAARKGATQMLLELGLPIDDFSEATIQSFLKDQAILLRRVNERTREALVAVMQDVQTGLVENLPVDDVIDNMFTSMKGVFNKTEGRRKAIARTETLRGLNGGRFEQMQASGAPQKEWLTVRDGSVRESHVDLDGTVLPIADSWLTILGNSLRYPHDPLAGPGDTVNCRCTLLAVFAKE